MNIPGEKSPKVRRTKAHAEILKAAGTSKEVADKLGIYSLPDGSGFVLPWRDEDGKVVVEQIRWTNTDDPDKKYQWPKDQPHILGCLRRRDESTRVVLIVEGFKQAASVYAVAGDDVAVYCVAGCQSQHVTDLPMVDGLPVVLIYDGDRLENRDVFDGAKKMARNCHQEGATSVGYADVQRRGTDGIDDHLGRKAADRRPNYLARLIAEPIDWKTRERRPDPKPKAKPTATAEDDDRTIVHTDGDLADVIETITAAMVKAYDGKTLFNYAGALSIIDGDKIRVLDRPGFVRESSKVIAYQKTTGVASRPDNQALDAAFTNVLAFTPLERLTRTPYFDADGRLVIEPGYDAATKTYLVDSDLLTALDISPEPTEDEIKAAKDLLRDEWLGDFPFVTEQDKTRAIGLLLTLIMRGSTGLVPMFVITATDKGAGKGLLGAVLSIVARGKLLSETALSDSEEEVRKVLTSAFYEGVDLLDFDEVRTLNSRQLARALTAENYGDRLLGVNKQISIPNNLTQIALGKNIQVVGDMGRRVDPIQLAADRADNYLRNDYRHPDLKAWTWENRPRLLSAAMTLIRAWFVAGQPPEDKSSTMGSFAKWDRMIGGILAHADMKGHLDGVAEWATSGDYGTYERDSYIAGLFDQWGEEEITSAQIVPELEGVKRGTIPPPPGFGDHIITLASRSGHADEAAIAGKVAQKLGMAHARMAGVVTRDGLVMKKVGEAHGGKAKWQISKVAASNGKSPGRGGTEGLGGASTTPPIQNPLRNPHTSSCSENTYKRAGGLPPSPSVPPEPGEMLKPTNVVKIRPRTAPKVPPAKSSMRLSTDDLARAASMWDDE